MGLIVRVKRLGNAGEVQNCLGAPLPDCLVFGVKK